MLELRASFVLRERLSVDSGSGDEACSERVQAADSSSDESSSLNR